MRIFFITILCLLLFILVENQNPTYAGDINTLPIINEFLFDPIGTDLGKEWIELYNPTESDIVMNNWKIYIAGSSFTQTATFSGIIESKSYFLICENLVENCNVNVDKIGLQNGGGATDAFYIQTNDNTVVDSVFYDTPNLNDLKDEQGSVISDSECAEIGVSGESLGRANYIDTNNSHSDFYIFATPTPGEMNILQISQDEIPQTGESLIPMITIFIISLFSGILLLR